MASNEAKAPVTRRRLILLRHAKSAWPTGVEDHDRPLAKRGEKTAPMVGAYLAREKLLPSLVLVSTARRTQETWKIVRGPLPHSVAKRDDKNLYEAPTVRLLGIIQAVEPTVATLMLIGHNPGLQDLALELAGSGDEAAHAAMAEKFPTAALAVIDFRADITPGSGNLERFVTPGSLA
jgi:phosphohistidine phosphatase